MSNRFNYGGQAVIEGVMIRGRKAMVTAVRRPGGGLAMNIQPISSFYSGWMKKTPMIRGIVVLIEAVLLGVKSLMYSANVSLEEDEEEISKKSMFGMIAVSASISIGLFFIAPLFLTKLANPFINSSLVFHLIEGVIRLAIFVAYLKIMSLIPDIKRVFEYHGAEHKTINAYEADVPMDIESIRKHSTAHMRCGTSFLFVVLIIAILVFALIGRHALWIMVLSRVLLIPVIAALGYEVTQFGARHRQNLLVRIILYPGLMLQSMTTGEPDDSQLEVAIAAFNKSVELDQSPEAAPTAS